jgi:serine/threonine protein kinase
MLACTQKKVGVNDFELLKVVGRGNFGKVMQVRKKDTGRIYAMKVLRKDTVIAADAVQHALSEVMITTNASSDWHSLNTCKTLLATLLEQCVEAIGASIHRQLEVQLPNGKQVVHDFGLSQWWYVCTSVRITRWMDGWITLIVGNCTAGELFYHLSNVDRFSESRARFYAAEIVTALGYLHENDVIYR